MRSMTVEQLAELAREVEIKDPIDWGLLTISEEDAYKLMASNVLEQFSSLNDDDRMIIAMSTITKLLVENFVLNLKIEGRV
jgi:hypothetical protein